MTPTSVVILLLGWTVMLVFGSILILSTVWQTEHYGAWLIPFAVSGIVTAFAVICAEEANRS
jgi:hypothetical protein